MFNKTCHNVLKFNDMKNLYGAFHVCNVYNFPLGTKTRILRERIGSKVSLTLWNRPKDMVVLNTTSGHSG